MKRCERFWTSDQNDAIARQHIQRGCSLFFPPEVMGAHIGPSRSHQTGRAIPLGFRAGTAMFGHMGIEWDVRSLDEDGRAELRAHLDNYKRHRALIHSGDLYRIPFEDAGGQGWAVVAPDGAEALVSLARWVPAQYTAAELVRVPGLKADADYRVRVLPPIAAGSSEIAAHLQDWAGDGKVIGGSVIRENGLRLAPTMPQCLNLLHIERV